MTVDLTATIDYMASEKPADIFKAEYYQTAIRYDRDRKLLSCEGDISGIPRELLEKKVAVMRSYLTVLQAEAAVRGIVVSIDDVRGAGDE